jgi:hypothetical protein
MALKIRTSLPRAQTPARPCLRRLQSGRRRARPDAVRVVPFLLLALSLCALPRNAAQADTNAAPKLVIPSEINVNLDESTEMYMRLIEIKSNEPKKWAFIRFVKLDSRLTVKTKASNQEFTDDPGKPLDSDKWYGFMGGFPLDLLLKPGGEKKGSLEVVIDQCQLPSAEGVKRDEAVAVVNNINCKPEQTLTKKVTVNWDTPDAGGTDGLLWYGKWIGIPLITLAVIFVILIFTGVFGKILDRLDERGLVGFFKVWGKRRGGSAAANTTGVQANADDPVAAQARISKQNFSELSAEVKRLETGLTRLESNLISTIEGNRGVSGEQLERVIRNQLCAVKDEILQQKNDLTYKVDSLETRLAGKVDDLNKKIVNEQGQQHHRHKEFLEARREVDGALLKQTSSHAEALRESLRSVGKQVDRLYEPDLASAKALGQLLGESVEALRPEGFAELADAVNRFFQERVQQDEGKLLEFQSKLGAVNSALQDLLREFQPANGQPAEELIPYVQRVGRVVSELNELCSQVKRKQFLLTANIHIPVSAHENARHTFLDELGLAIKREINKLRDPSAYFERQLEDIATSEIIAITDICDKKLGLPPRHDSQLEGSLQSLFTNTGLSPILPKLNEDYRTVDQEVVGTVSNPSPEIDQRMKVAKVVSRGFLFQQNGAEPVLIRKASVEVYS